MLEALQTQASQVGGASGVGMRAKITGKSRIKKGFETGMGAYQDVLTGFEGARGRAGETYDIAGGAYGAAETAYGLAGEGAEFGYRTGMYELEKTRAGDYVTDVLGTFAGDTTYYFGDPGETAVTEPDYYGKEGGRVPTFTEILSRIPEAGGS